MKSDSKILQISLSFILILLFLSFSVYGHSLGLIVKNFSTSNLINVEFEVFLINDNDKVEPAKDALVVVGLENNRTDDYGKASIMISPGSYSSYVKLNDIKLAPYTDKLVVKNNCKIIVTFRITKLFPNRFSVELSENYTIVRLGMILKEEYRAYISDPVLTLVRNDGTVTVATAGPNGHGYFTERIIPGRPHEIIIMINGSFSYIDPHSSYVPLEIINVKKA